MKLENKTALVCAAGRGIGEAIAVGFAREGADVALADIDGDSARRVAGRIDALGRRSLAMQVDLTVSAAIADMVTQTVDRFSRIDILVNNQGSGKASGRLPFGVLEEEEYDWDQGFALNLRSPFLVVKAVAPHMIKQKYGKIVNIASISAKMGTITPIVYASTKGGVVTMTRSLARELAPYNVNVNSICPGFIYTPQWEEMAQALKKRYRRFAQMELRDIYMDTVRRFSLLKREQTVDDVAHAAVFLASDDACNITGQSLNVDGGTVFD